MAISTSGRAWDELSPVCRCCRHKPVRIGQDIRVGCVWFGHSIGESVKTALDRIEPGGEHMSCEAQVVHQVMAHNGQMHNVQVAPKAAPFPPLPVSLSRQQMPDRDPGSFTPPAAGVGSFVGRVPDGTPTSRAKSPAQPQGLLVRAGKSPPRMPGPKSSLGLPSSASARNTPKPQPRPVVSFAPVRSPSPGQRPSREEEGRSPSPDRKGQRDPSCGKDARPDGRIRADFRDACEEAHSGAHSGSRTSRHSEAETIPEEPHYDAERAARERELLAMQESQPLRCVGDTVVQTTCGTWRTRSSIVTCCMIARRSYVRGSSGSLSGRPTWWHARSAWLTERLIWQRCLTD